jgi:hypothetical protein
MVKKLAILGFILVVVTAAGMAWAGTYSGAIPAPQPTMMPASAPACVGPACAPPPRMAPVKPKKLVTSIKVDVQYPEQQCSPLLQPPVGCQAPPIPVAVPMWRFIVPWPPFVYYLPVE